MKRRDFMLQTAATFFTAATTPRIFRPSKRMNMKSPVFKTALCDLLKIEYSILQEGMADVATPGPVLPPGLQLMNVMDILKKAGQSGKGEYFSL